MENVWWGRGTGRRGSREGQGTGRGRGGSTGQVDQRPHSCDYSRARPGAPGRGTQVRGATRPLPRQTVVQRTTDREVGIKGTGEVLPLPPQEQPEGEGLLMTQLSEQQSSQAGFQGEGFADLITKGPAPPPGEAPCRHKESRIAALRPGLCLTGPAPDNPQPPASLA